MLACPNLLEIESTSAPDCLARNTLVCLKVCRLISISISSSFNVGFRILCLKFLPVIGLLNADGVKTMSSFKNYGSGKYNTDPDAISSKNVVPNQEVNYGSDLFDTEIVFTGELASMKRKDAIQRAVNNGAIVGKSVTKRTNFLIVGISDFIDFDKGKITNKLKKAKDLSDKGQDISIIDEQDFLRMTI